MELVITRDVFTEDSSLGSLFIEDQFECYTLEDKYREIPDLPISQWKVPRETAIPLGRYELVVSESRRSAQGGLWSPHLHLLPLLLDVPGWEGVRIHAGNSNTDTDGCIIVGTQRTADTVENSRTALTTLMAKLEATREQHFLTIA